MMLLALLVLIQFVGPRKTNPPIDQAQTLEAHTEVTPGIAAILTRACQDCHTHKTRWPWYSHVAPVSWFVIDHVNHGRKHVNLSHWAEYDPEKALHQLREICEQVESGTMPIGPYLVMHPQARISDEDIRNLCEWTETERGRILSASGTRN